MLEGQRKTSFMIDEETLYGDFKCIGTTRDDKTLKYIMKCQKCGKIKNMLKSTIKANKGLNHRSCGKGLGIAYDKYFYQRWSSMRQRTSDKSIHKENYYDRGIDSDAFASFIDFYNAMYPSWQEHVSRFGVHDTSLERIDVDKPYSPENCTWVCLDEQKGNVQKTLYFTVEDLDTKEIQYCKNAHKYSLENHLPYYIQEVINKNGIYRNKKYTRITKEEYATYHLKNKTFNNE